MTERCNHEGCTTCALERQGCVHQRKTSEWVPECSDGCYVCQPESYERPRCTPTCHHCGKSVPRGYNYCPSRAPEAKEDCLIASWRASGAKEYLPNGLPIQCLQADPPLLLECEHGAHPDYLFPVDVDYIGAPIPEEEDYPREEFHALIYTDGCIALTLYECEYHLWGLSDGKELPRFDRGWRKGDYRLSDASRVKIVEWAEKHNKYPREG